MNGIPVPPVASKGAGPTDANTLRVVVATDDTVTVSDNALPLPSNAAQENNGNLSAILTELQAENASDGPSFVAVTGDPSGDFAGVNLLEAVMDDATGLYLNTKVINPAKLDANGAMMASDAPAPINLKFQAVQTIVIDTIGYQSIHVTTGVGLVAVASFSNDGVTFGAAVVYNSAAVVNSIGSIAASSAYMIPIAGRYLKIVSSAAGSAVLFLRSGSAAQLATGISHFGGSPVVTGGIAGSIAVGSANNAGAAPTNNPVVAAGVDSGEIKLPTALTAITPAALTRRLLTDTLGRTRLAAENAFASQGGQVLSVTDQSQLEGQSPIELLAMILQEMKIMTHYLSELPRMLNAGLVTSDEPATFRNDPTIFNQ